jgi:alkylation response protein AidB-like acyl-CoA dehydrogenase
MNFALSEDHEFLRDVARTFVRKEIDLAPLLIPGATVANANYDANWKKIGDIGWPGLIVPEVYGGSEMSCIDLAMVIGEMGRGLAPSPFFGTLAATWALLRAASDEQKSRLLPAIAAGNTSMALAIADANGSVDEPSFGTPAVVGGPPGVVVGDTNAVAAGDMHGAAAGDTHAIAARDAYVLNGTKSFVVDAASASMLVVAAHDGTSRRFFVVDARQAGVRTEVLAWRDITRQVCNVTFENARGELLPVDVATAWPWIRDRLLLVLSLENAAGIEHVLETTTAYAKERVAFGRPIGSYQSIKHDLADTFGASECANVLSLYAAWALSHDAVDASNAAAMAQSYTSQAYVAATEQSVQIFGAIGFSWEMENHLYFKRARANATLFGSPSVHRARLMDALERSIREETAA